MPSTATAMKKKSIYSVHPGLTMVQKWVADLKQKTGRSLEEWLRFVEKSGPKDEKERRDWLKQEHGLGTNAAWWIAERSVGKGTETDAPDHYLEAAEGYVEQMFSGSRSELKPIYDALLRVGLKVGKEAKACHARPSFRCIAITCLRKSNQRHVPGSISALLSAI